ncbi:putative NOT transcription complex subunit VIP2 [Hordeum vulgare]|nr:putative NOT transcription complex subunit VIP2 [Hordeum vulgare]
MDMRADSYGLASHEWALRYSLEDELLEIYRKEEAYWREWGACNWVHFGDANTAYFQPIANVRRRRCTIPLLCDGDLLVQEPGEIRVHVDGFYNELFAARQWSGIAHADSIWERGQHVTATQNRALLAPFDEGEVASIIKGMNPSSDSGPYGLSVRFF